MGGATEPGEVLAPPRDAKQAEIASLTGMRGFAALVVMLVHAAGRTRYPEVGIHGYGPVALFTLSGFLLFRPWSRWALGAGARPSIPQFFRRRVFRIFPAYLVVVLAMAVIYPASQPNGLDGWARALTLTGTFASDGLRPGLEQTWSLGTELTWYVVLPVLGLLLGTLVRRRPARSATWWLLGALALALPITVLYRLYVQWNHLGPRFTWSFWLPGFLLCFAAGAIVSLLIEAERSAVIDLGRLRRWLVQPAVVLTVAAALIAIDLTPPLSGPLEYSPATFSERSVRFACCAALALLLLAAATIGGSGGLVSRFMSQRWLVTAGRWSFGIYLWHLPVIELLNDDFTHRDGPDGFVLWVSVIFAVSITLGAATFAWVERPMMAWARREPRHAAR